MIRNLCYLPRVLRSRGDVTAVDLVRESGFLASPEGLMREVIEAVLAAEPQLVDDWMRYSEDKRVSEGWYFKRGSENNNYLVGFYPGSLEDSYTNQFAACARYVEEEIKSIATHAT